MAEAKNAALIIRYADGNVNKFIFTRPEDEMNAISGPSRRIFRSTPSGTPG
jgi:hypothetical protein